MPRPDLKFLVTEVTDKMEPKGYLRAVTYQVMHDEHILDDGQCRWAAPTKDELPAYAVGDEFELAPKQEYGSIRIVNRYPTLQVGQLWWLSERRELVKIMEINGPGHIGPAVRARVLSEVGGKENLGDDVMLWGNVHGITPEYGPVFIAHADRKVAS